MPAESIDAYLAAQPEHARAVLERIRALVHAAEPAVVEKISYGMPTYVLEGRHAIYTAAWKKHVGIYPVHAAPDPLEQQLAPYRAAKDTVQYVYAAPMPDATLEALIAFLVTPAAHPGMSAS